jgi:hypothetical protein
MKSAIVDTICGVDGTHPAAWTKPIKDSVTGRSEGDGISAAKAKPTAPIVNWKMMALTCGLEVSRLVRVEETVNVPHKNANDDYPQGSLVHDCAHDTEYLIAYESVVFEEVEGNNMLTSLPFE